MPDAQPELSGAPLALGIYGKMPAHGDFVRRGLPSSFVTPWDAWLSAGVAAAREQLEEGFAAVWDEAPAWRFSLPAGVCGPDAVAGVMLPSEDTVGRRFPLTAAALLPPGVVAEEVWFARLEAAVRAARHGSIDADGMIRAMQSLPESAPETASGDVLGMLGGGMAGGVFAIPTAVDAGAPTPAADVGYWHPPPDAMDSPAGAAAPEPAADMWGALLGDSPLDSPAADPMEGPAPISGEQDWGVLLGEAPLSASDAPPASSPGVDTEIWGHLLGDPAPEPAADAPSLVVEASGDGLVGDPAEAPSTKTVDAESAAENIHRAVGGHDAGESTWGNLLGDGAAAPDPSEPSPAAASALVATERIPAAETPPQQLCTDTASPQQPHAPVRPPEGGWWTLGGARLSPMVWPLPELPPAESFILLLHNQDPESGA